jgi:hypothetical protein
VLIQTKSFGAVTLDHPAHLSRKIACKQCHGPGPVRKPEFTPKTAHEACVGCHRDHERGPTKCRECHIVPPSQNQAPIQVADAKESAAAGSARPASGAEGASKALVVASSAGPSAAPTAGKASVAPVAAAAPSAPASLGADVTDSAPGGFVRAVGVGYSGLRSSGQDFTTGVAFFLTAHEERFLFVQSFERTIGGLGGSGGRTLGLTGAGVTLPLRGRFNMLAVGVGGFDAAEKPTATVLPAAGLRLGVEWMGRQSCVSLWATGVTDLIRSTDSVTHDTIGGTTFSLTMTAGFVLDRP